MVVLVTLFAEVSGAHFNPAVTLARTLSNSFVGVAPVSAPDSAPAFILRFWPCCGKKERPPQSLASWPMGCPTRFSWRPRSSIRSW